MSKEPTLQERLASLDKKLHGDFFLKDSGTNGIGFYLFPYESKEELRVQAFIRKKLAEGSACYRYREVNLYRTFLSICEERHVLGAIPSMEAKKGDAFLLEQLQRLADPKVFAERIKDPDSPKNELLFLDGVGEVYPILRVHNLLENMQGGFAETPVLIFYPGLYDGWHLTLFEKHDDQHHYRSCRLL